MKPLSPFTTFFLGATIAVACIGTFNAIAAPKERLQIVQATHELPVILDDRITGKETLTITLRLTQIDLLYGGVVAISDLRGFPIEGGVTGVSLGNDSAITSTTYYTDEFDIALSPMPLSLPEKQFIADASDLMNAYASVLVEDFSRDVLEIVESKSLSIRSSEIKINSYKLILDEFRNALNDLSTPSQRTENILNELLEFADNSSKSIALFQVEITKGKKANWMEPLASLHELFSSMIRSMTMIRAALKGSLD